MDYSETCLERPHVSLRTVAQDRWSPTTGETNMICKRFAIGIIDFLRHLIEKKVAIYRF